MNVNEVAAKAPNVMLGYFENDTATQQVRILVDRFNGIPSLSEQIRELRDRLQLKE